MPKPQTNYTITFSPDEIKALNAELHILSEVTKGEELFHHEENMKTAHTAVHYKVQRAYEKVKRREQNEVGVQS